MVDRKRKGQPGMTPPTERDAAAFTLIAGERAKRLTRATQRAEHWIAGLSALVTVLTTAMVVKGPDNFSKAEGAVRFIVLALIIGGVVGLGSGLVCAYTAAYGGLVKMSAVDALLQKRLAVAEAAGALETAVSSDAKTSQRFMRIAVVATVIAMLCLMSATAFSWFATAPNAPRTFTCLQTSKGIVQLAGSVTITDGNATVVKCP